MRKPFLFFMTLPLLMTGCSSYSTITEYNDKGEIARITETKEDLSKSLTLSLKEKSVLYLRTGWAARIKATPSDVSNGGTANFELSIGSLNAAYSSIPASAASASAIAEKHAEAIQKVLQTELKASAEGVSGKSGIAQ